MKLTEIYNKPLKEILEECDIISQQFHTDDDGNIKAIEMKYKPKEHEVNLEVPSFLNNRRNG